VVIDRVVQYSVRAPSSRSRSKAGTPRRATRPAADQPPGGRAPSRPPTERIPPRGPPKVLPPNAFSAGTGPGAATAETGPPEIARHTAGQGLFTAQPTVTGPGPGPPGRPTDQVSDPTADTFSSANGSKTPAGDNLDLTRAAVADDGDGGVTITMRVKNLTSLQPALTAGGTTAAWITRFTTYNAGKTPGNGHILYAGS